MKAHMLFIAVALISGITYLVAPARAIDVWPFVRLLSQRHRVMVSRILGMLALLIAFVALVLIEPEHL